MKRAVPTLLAMLLLLLSGCSSTAVSGASGTPAQETAEDQIRFCGRVVLVPIEGGFYGLVSDAGARYDPVSLPPGFREDGLRVRVTGRPLSGAVGYHMWGTRIEVLAIAKE